MTAPEEANAQQLEYWNQVAGPKWVALQEQLDLQIEAAGQLALDAAQPQPGESVLDVGCGCGATALALAERVAPGGHVLGVDLSEPMLARARERAAGNGALEFRQADAQTHAFEPGSADLVFSRFGVMFFDDPVAAFANLRRAAGDSGRLAFVCWRGVVENPWVRVPLQAVADLVELPPPPPPGSPGPMALADPERLRGLLEAGGWEQIEIEGRRLTMQIGGPVALDASVAFTLQMGPVGSALRDSPPAVMEKAATAVRKALLPYAGDDGVQMEGAVWCVSARGTRRSSRPADATG
ncbi:MAG: methyltransferase domain-containing protein [Proteobacteria bacterium]|nr:methyltransferase domain-containing protein [Pseudomonadota bacterium]